MIGRLARAALRPSARRRAGLGPACACRGAARPYSWPRSPRLCRPGPMTHRSEEHTSELQSHSDLVCRLLLEKKKMQVGADAHGGGDGGGLVEGVESSLGPLAHRGRTVR